MTLTTGGVWQFFKLQETTVTIDLSEYSLPSTQAIFAGVLQMASQE